MAPPVSVVVAVLLLLVACRAAADDNNIVLSCMMGQEKILCVLTMRADPRAVACPNRACLAPIAVEHAIRNASDTRAAVLGVLSNDPTQRYVSAMHTCGEVYANAMARLAQALPMAKAGNYIGADEAVGLARKQAAGCEAAFPSQPSPVAALNKVCAAMLVVAQDLIEIGDRIVVVNRYL